MTEQRVQIEDLLQQSTFLQRLAHTLVRDDARADDLVQDVWLAAVKSPPKPGNERAWLGKVLKHRNLDRLRSTHTDLPLHLGDEEEVTETPLDVAESLEAQSLLMAAIEELGEPHQSLVVARYFMGQTPREIAENRKIPSATIRCQLTRALEMLRKQLDQKMDGNRRSWALLLLPMALHDANLTGTATILGSTQVALKSFLVAMQQNVAAVISILLASSVALFIYVSRPGEEQGLTPDDTAAIEQQPRIVSGEEKTPSSASLGALETPTPTATAKTQRLRILDPDRKALAFARVVLFEGDAILAAGSTNDDGFFRPEGISRERRHYSYAVLTPGWPVKVGTIDMGQETEIVLDVGEELSGTVEIAGDVNFRTLKLFYLQKASLNPKLPKAVTAKLWSKRREERRLFCHVSPDGSFRFQGLPTNSRGQFILEPGFGFDEGEAKFRRRRKLRQLTKESRLKVVALSRFTGRVIAAENGEPIADQMLMLRTFNENGLLREQPIATTDAKGQFVLNVEYAQFTEAQVVVLRGGATIELPRHGFFRDTIPLGDIPVRALVLWPYQVFTMNDETIAMAKIAVGTKVIRDKKESARSFVVELDPSISQVYVGAKGYQIKVVSVQNLGGEPQRITLEKTNELDLSFASSEVVEVSQLRLTGGRTLLPQEYHEQLIGRFYGLRSLNLDVVSTGEQTQITLKYHPKKPIILPNFTPNARFTIEALDSHGQVLAQQADVSLAAQETQALTLSFDANLYKITNLTVTDVDGKSLAQVQIDEMKHIGIARETITASKGLVRLVRRRNSRASGVVIKKIGYRSQELSEAELINGPIEIKLIKE